MAEVQAVRCDDDGSYPMWVLTCDSCGWEDEAYDPLEVSHAMDEHLAEHETEGSD